MKSKDVKKLLALSTMAAGLNSAILFSGCGVYGPMEANPQEYDPALETSIAEYGVFEIMEESDTENTEESDMVNQESDEVLQEAPCVYGPKEWFEGDEESSETQEMNGNSNLNTLETIPEEPETSSFDPSKEEIPSVYGVKETYATE